MTKQWNRKRGGGRRGIASLLSRLTTRQRRRRLDKMARRQAGRNHE